MNKTFTFILLTIFISGVSAQTKAMSELLAPKYQSDYDGGYGAISPMVLESRILNDSQASQKVKEWGSKEAVVDTIDISWIKEKYNVNTCELYEKFLPNVTYCYLNDSSESTERLISKPSRKNSKWLFLLFGTFALYPLCKRNRK